MKLPRREFLHLAAGAAALPFAPHVARAQAYPSRPVKIVVGQAAGSATDIVVRLFGQSLSEKLGQQFIIEIRPGAAGNIATEAVTHMPPDGYSLLAVNSQNAINVALYEKLNFDFVRDIAPIALVETVPLIMEVHPSVPAKTVVEFVARQGQSRASSTWHRPASAARSISPANCSSSWPAWTSPTSPTGARRRPSPISSRARCR